MANVLATISLYCGIQGWETAQSRVPASNPVMPVISKQPSTPLMELKTAQHADNQLSTVIKALTSNSPLLSLTAAGLSRCFLDSNGLLCRTFQGLANNTLSWFFQVSCVTQLYSNYIMN